MTPLRKLPGVLAVDDGVHFAVLLEDPRAALRETP